MSNDLFAPLGTIEDLDGAIARSHDAPSILFLHDRWCPISANAFREMSRLDGDAAAQTALVDVTRGQELSHAIAERTGVRHESPQVIVLRDGKAAWHASHFAITAKAVSDALARTD